MAIEFIKRGLICDRLLSIDGNNPHIFLACVVSWWPDGEFGILSVTQGIIKYSSSNELKRILFSTGGNSI